MVDVVTPPQTLDVVFEFNSERPIIPRRSEPAVNLARLKNKPAPLTQRHDFVHVNHSRSYLKVNFSNLMDGDGRVKNSDVDRPFPSKEDANSLPNRNSSS
jgi:hypothetical protein